LITVILPDLPLERQLALYELQGQDQLCGTGHSVPAAQAPGARPDMDADDRRASAPQGLSPGRAALYGLLSLAAVAIGLGQAFFWLVLWGMSACSSMPFLILGLLGLLVAGCGLIGAPVLWAYALMRLIGAL